MADHEVAATTQPSPQELGRVRVESILARHLVRRALYVAPVIILVALVLRGQAGAIASAVGIAVVITNFLVGGWLMSTALRISLAFYHAAALLGFALRLGLITATMLVIARVFDIDRMAFGLSVVVSYMVLLALEAAAVARGDEMELNWVV